MYQAKSAENQVRGGGGGGPETHFGFGILKSDETLKIGIFCNCSQSSNRTNGRHSEQMRCFALETVRLKI